MRSSPLEDEGLTNDPDSLGKPVGSASLDGFEPQALSLALNFKRQYGPCGNCKLFETQAICFCHRAEGADATVILEGQLHDFTDLPAPITFVRNVVGIDIERSCI